MTLLRGLGVEELSTPELTGEWEFKLAQMEHGKLERDDFMREIAEMTKHIVKKAKEYDSDTVPGDYATLDDAVPELRRRGQGELPPLRLHRQAGRRRGLRLLVQQDPGRARLRARRSRAASCATSRSARWRASAPRRAGRSPPEIMLKYDDEKKNWKLEFDFGDDGNAARPASRSTSRARSRWAPARRCGGARLRVTARNYVCEHACRRSAQPTPTCDFKSGKIILQQPVEREQMTKLLATGKTDLLDEFVSKRTRRAVQGASWPGTRRRARSLRVRARSKFPPAQGRPPAVARRRRRQAAAARPAAQEGARRRPARAAKKAAAPKAPRKTGAGLKPSAELAAVIGDEPVARTEVIKKLWDYIKANGLQDARTSAPSTPTPSCSPVFGKAQVTMFELAGIVGKHLA